MTLAITLSLWRAEHISQARCVAAGPRARAEPPRAQPGADGGSRQPGTGTRPGRRMRAGREVAGGGQDKALGGRGDAWRETETNTSASGLAGRPARRFAGPAGRHGFRRRAIISLDAAARLLSGRGGKRQRPQPARPCLSAHAEDPRCLRDARRPASRTPPHSSGTWSRGPGKARSLSAPIALFK